MTIFPSPKPGKQRITKFIHCLYEFIKLPSLSNFRCISRYHVQVCRQLHYFLSKIHFMQDIQKLSYFNIHTRFQEIATFLTFTQYQKYGHSFPKFKFVLAKFQKRFQGKLKSNVTQQKNIFPETNIIHNIKLKQITENEKKILLSSQINHYLSKLTENQLIINDAACVCCSRSFTKKVQIVNNNPAYPNLVGLSDKEAFEFATLQQYICAVANAGGGNVIIGGNLKNGSIIGKGVKFNNQQQVHEKRKKINQALYLVKPFYQSTVEIIYIHSNYLAKQTASVLKQMFRCAFRITINNVQHMRRLYYLQIKPKGYHAKYQSYKFDKNMKPLKYSFDCSKINQQKLSLYDLMMQKFNERRFIFKRNTNIHRNILCYQPYNTYSQVFYKFIQQKQITNLQGFDQSLLSISSLSCESEDDRPKFTKVYTSLLVVQSVKYQRIVTDLIPYFQKLKYNCQISKPFSKSFKQSIRKIWMINHQQKYEDVKKKIKQFDKNEHIIIMPVCRTLQVQKAKLSEYYQKIVEDRFKKKFKGVYQKQVKNFKNQKNQLIQFYNFCFNQHEELIYCYLLLDEINVKPYSVLDNTVYNKMGYK